MKRLLSRLQALRSFIILARDPRRLDVVFSLRASIDDMEMLRPVVERMRQKPAPAAALRERPLIGTMDLDRLATLPEGSLGRTYAEWMRAMNLDPSALPTLPAQNELEYFTAHLYETHDIWHVVTGFGPDEAGELGLQAFYLAQIHGPLPLAILAAGLLNTLKHTDQIDLRMNAIARGWQMGQAARPFFGVRWAEMWSRPLAEIRRELEIGSLDVKPPAAPRAYAAAAA